MIMTPNISELQSFFNGMQFYLDVSRDLRKSWEPHVAPSFSVFDYISMDENILSRIIADLLDPKGPHGQGALFLECFLRLLSEKNSNFKLPNAYLKRINDARVKMEARTAFLVQDARRIDIRIELPPSALYQAFGIGIENKPWAIEQENQLADYRDELQGRYPDGFILVFLCQQGRTPASINEQDWTALCKEGRGALISFTVGFLSWLSECRMRCQADKIRHFLADFERYVQANLGGSGIDEESSDVDE